MDKFSKEKKYFLFIVYIVTIVLVRLLNDEFKLKAYQEEIKRYQLILTEYEYDDNLNLCYLCGGKALIKSSLLDSFYIECEECGITTRYFDSKEDLILYWKNIEKK